MRYLLLILLTLTTMVRAQARDFTVYGPRLKGDYRFDLSAFLPADRLRLQEIQEQLPRLHTYEDFLDFIATRRPSLFSDPVLIHDTGSLQYADLDHPRVILFGDGLMLTFAEDPRRSERTVEVIAFEGEKFKFAELKFQQDGVHFESEPSHCQTCHGMNPRPLWDPYDFWPNAYGSSIGRFGKDTEKQAYERIRLKTSKQGIYGRIQWPVPPGNNNSGLAGIETFTQYVTQLQIFSSLQRWQKESTAFSPMIPALLAVSSECATDPNDATAAQKLAAFFPEPWKNLVETNFPAWHQKVQSERRRFKSYQSARYQQLFPQGRPVFAINHERLASETQTIAQLFLVLELAGIDARSFPMSQGLNPFILSVPSNLNFDLATDFALVAADLFQKLSPSLTNGGGYGYSWAQFDCQSLEEESLQRLQNIKMVSTSLSKFKPAPTVLGECMNCHSIDADKRGIPSIPFDRTGSLRNYLQAGGLSKILERIQKTGPGQMPPYRSLSADEKDQLHRNLELIAK